MKTTSLILCLGLTALACPTRGPDRSTESSPAPVPTQARPPYVVRSRALDDAAAAALRADLAKLEGVDEVEVFPGGEGKVHVHTAAGCYVSRTQIAGAFGRHGLELEAFEIPPWARMRVYVVEASGGA